MINLYFSKDSIRRNIFFDHLYDISNSKMVLFRNKMLMDDVMMYVIINVPIKCLMWYVEKSTEWCVLWFGTKSYRRRLLNNRIFAWKNTFYVWVVHETFKDFYVCCHELQSSTLGFFAIFLKLLWKIRKKKRQDIL